METPREQEILGIILEKEPIAISEIQPLLSTQLSIPSLNRTRF